MTSQPHPRVLSLGASIVLCVLCGVVRAQVAPGDRIQHQFVVTLLPGQSIAAITAQFAATVIGSYPTRNLFLLQTSESFPDDVMFDVFELDDRVAQFEQNSANGVVWGNTQSFFVRAEPSTYQSQEIVSLLGLATTQATATGSGVTVAVLDTGVAAHPLLIHNLRADGYNYVDGNTATDEAATGTDSNANGVPDELFGHGTFVAGIVVLVAPECQIIPVKVLDSDGMGTAFSVAAGIYHAIDHNARIINLSLSAPRNSPLIQSAVAAANAAGVVVIGAVGNNHSPLPSYPAALPGVIAVTATDMTDHKSAFGDYGTFVSLSAPGTSMVSTSPDGGFSMASGTSFAAAVVTGTAALCESLDSAPLAPSNIRSHLLGTAVRIDQLNPDYRQMLGRGRISPLMAVKSFLIKVGAPMP